ncbi:hypothetical protein EXIGLDRAFT_838022 [Exidia glandulosa HHB12029]|uniref:Uncharacterized protein n=1 Tax=Exidia glandulosa HHB12029 TaxID=1314781 RepID=A0A166AAN7_EXIGL|nr:hypothetical protein EXIGLDRAFT_838022 [Exidia glandulosa HHB12029]
MLLVALFLPFLLALAAAQLVVDDSSAQVVYSPTEVRSCASPQDCFGVWFLDTRSINLDNTLHVTGGPDTFLEFTFTGTNVTVFGATLPNGAGALITVDDGAATRISTTSNPARFQASLFSSEILAPGDHKIRIAFDGDPTKGELLGIDSFQVSNVEPEPEQPPTAPEQSPSTPVQSPEDPAPSSSQSSQSSEASPSQSGDAAPSESTPRRFPAGAAAAIGFGCALAAILLAIALWTFGRRRIKSASSPKAKDEAPPAGSWWDFVTTQPWTTFAPDHDVEPGTSHVATRDTWGRPADLSISIPRGGSSDSPVARWASSVHSATMSANTRTAPRVVAYSSPSRSQHSDGRPLIE